MNIAEFNRLSKQEQSVVLKRLSLEYPNSPYFIQIHSDFKKEYADYRNKKKDVQESRNRNN